MKTIIVTGGAGFIGSHLCDRLVWREDTVICLDNLLTGSQKNIVHLMNNPKFFFFKHDVTLPFKSRKFKKIDEIYHLASPADPNTSSPFSYMNHPFETMLVNSVGTWNMCELAIKYNSRLLFSSTSEIYGDPQVSPQGEDYRGNVSPIGPRSVYDEAKRFGETIIAAFVRRKNLDARITRIFNTYGPRMNIDEGRVIVSFIRQVLANEPLTVYGDGSQTRSFCYIDDQVSGQILAMEKGKPGRVYNIGTQDERSVLSIAKMVKEKMRSAVEIVFEPLPEDDPRQRKPDISRARGELGWEPKIKLEEGLSRTIEYFRKTNF